jgi:SNF2 family DNA or RNA helicase
MTPDDFRAYQVQAARFCLRNGCAGLFLDMGLGKTAIIETVIRKLKLKGSKPALVVGPIRVIKTVWRQEAKLWTHLADELTFSMVRGTDAQRQAALATRADVYLVNPEMLKWLFDELGDRLEGFFDVLVIDESSMYKNAGTKRFTTLRHKLHHFKYRYVLTGTPTPNSLWEIWTQVYILDLGKRLGTSFNRFKWRFFAPDDYTMRKWTARPGAHEYIYKTVGDLIMRLDGDDYNHMPQMIENKIWVELPNDARAMYDDMEMELMAGVDAGSVTAANAGVASMKCRQIANGVVYLDDEEDGTRSHKESHHVHSAKLTALEEALDEIHEPVIVVYQFRHELELIKHRLISNTIHDWRRVEVLSESEDVEKTIEDWNAKKIDVLLLQPASGGHGLNLQHGGHVFIWFSLTWSLEQYQQTIARLYRQGQTKPVIVHKIMASNTIDESLDGALRSKERGQLALLNALRARTKTREQNLELLS